MMNKKGVSAVVATVLIIMITVAAVAIIWMTVIPMIKETAEKGTTCFNAQTDLEIVMGDYTCGSNKDSKNSTVQVSRKANSAVNVSSVQVSWIAGGTTVNTTKVTAPAVNGMSVYTINVTTSDITAVQIAPIIKVGNAEETCEALPTKTIPICP
jgi:flagellin-like protein